MFLYLRKSTEENSEKQIRSIADQRRDCMFLVERFSLTVVEEFVENKSAWKPHQRLVFKEMLKKLAYKDPKKRTGEGILAWHPNRLSRNALEAGMLVQMLDDELIKDMFFPSYSFHNDTS